VPDALLAAEDEFSFSEGDLTAVHEDSPKKNEDKATALFAGKDDLKSIRATEGAYASVEKTGDMPEELPPENGKSFAADGEENIAVPSTDLFIFKNKLQKAAVANDNTVYDRIMDIAKGRAEIHVNGHTEATQGSAANTDGTVVKTGTDGAANGEVQGITGADTPHGIVHHIIREEKARELEKPNAAPQPESAKEKTADEKLLDLYGDDDGY
jgi:hypothetical protein